MTKSVSPGQAIRKILIAAVKNGNGYISRAGICLPNPAGQFSPVILSVGTNDAGTSFTDFYFHTNGRITSPAGSFALVSEIQSAQFSATRVTSEPSTPNTIYTWANSVDNPTPSGKYGTCFVFNSGTVSKLFISDSGENPMYWKTAAGNWRKFAMTDELPKVFVQSAAPTSGMKDGDIWVKS